MIRYVRCSETENSSCFEAFMNGFQDYFIKISLTQEQFFKRFLGPEGNRLEHSFIGFDGDKPVGIVLGGIRAFCGMKTFRCGGMSVDPEYRNKGVGTALFNHHHQEATKENCQQLYLEVITHNLPALSFYEKYGYQKVYDLLYYVLPDARAFSGKRQHYYTIHTIDMGALKALRDGLMGLHLNWQNEMETIQELENEHIYGVEGLNGLDGAISISDNGVLHFLWVRPELRGKSMASSLLSHVIKHHDLQRVRVSFPNNLHLTRFMLQMGFDKEPIAQYEMIAPLYS